MTFRQKCTHTRTHIISHQVFCISNGTGKSSLAMSTLWALTGSIDPRPASDAKVSDIVNDFSKVRV
jgi:DNA repair exonuclease SbcCD ATPase subunit